MLPAGVRTDIVFAVKPLVSLSSLYLSLLYTITPASIQSWTV